MTEETKAPFSTIGRRTHFLRITRVNEIQRAKHESTTCYVIILSGRIADMLDLLLACSEQFCAQHPWQAVLRHNGVILVLLFA